MLLVIINSVGLAQHIYYICLHQYHSFFS